MYISALGIAELLLVIELDKETINLDVNGTQQTVNVTSNDSWTWAQAAARTVLRMMGR